MYFLQVKEKLRAISAIWLLILSLAQVAMANPEYYAHDFAESLDRRASEVRTLNRVRRDVDTATNATAPAPSPPAANALNVTTNTTIDTKTQNANDIPSSTPTAVVTKTPLLGVNGSGIYRLNATAKTPKVSDPIIPDDNISDVFRETPETIKAEQNIANLTYDNHNFYNSTFMGSLAYFNEYWTNITSPKAEIHDVLSNSHRRATTLKLTFDFPFYGHPVRNITVATGGFIYTGDHVHNWLAATQYIAPLMANFDTTLTNDSFVKMYDDGERFTVFWENATLQEDQSKKFNFAVTLYKNGDIVFAYKDIPIPVQMINDGDHPVKVGISDAYLNDKILFYVRRKTIYEYHRVSFKNYEISNNTILKLVALPTCLQYNSCDTCVNHDTGFDCLWCEQIRKCSSGTDRNKQDWLLRNCDKNPISNATSCPARTHLDEPADKANTAYTTDTQNNHDSSDVSAVILDEVTKRKISGDSSPVSASSADRPTTREGSPLGGVVAAFVIVSFVCAMAAWVLYAFKNPHTRSGQLLIKYRPSQWSWRRGEARYTAATIHM